MTAEASITTMRVALRMANSFALDLLGMYRGKRDFTDALILATLVQCNSAPVAGQPELQRRYAVFDTPVPDDMRRAISINAISASLGLPFETVRRRAKQLIADGACESTPQGLRVPQALLGSSAHRRALEASYARVRSLYMRLARASCVQLMGLPPSAAPAWPEDEPPVRIVWRAAAEYFLRMMEVLVPNFTNLTRAFIVLEVARANTEGLSDSVRGEDGIEPDDFVPDQYRHPVRASEIASALGLPHETVRRNLAVLIEEGRCRRVRDGIIVPAEVLARSTVLAAGVANFRNLSRMFAELAETGVLPLWDAEARVAGTAA